jgi:hypothetical protein
MTTRFDAKDSVNYGVPGVKSGYDGLRSDFSIPSCGIEDVDVAIFNLFDKEILLMVGGQDSADLKKVPVVFAAGEKWALLKKGKPIRDRNNTLILPLVTIMRTGVTQQSNSDINGRGINQQTGEIVVRRRLDASDRNYQNLINRLFIENQKNVAVNPDDKMVLNQISTDRKVGELEDDFFVNRGGLLRSNKKNNIYETIVIPSPQFYTATYEVVVWTQFTQHMNQVVEKIMSSFLPQAQSWKLNTAKGYWFIASIDSGEFNTETNFDDMSTVERFIKLKFTIKVPAYVWASSAPGVPVPVKKYVSSPIIKFELFANRAAQDATGPAEVVDNYTLGSDDPTLPLDEQANNRDDQRSPGWRQQKVQNSNSDEVDANDPALLSYPRGVNPFLYKKINIGGANKYVRLISTNATTGETVYSASDLEGLKVIPG